MTCFHDVRDVMLREIRKYRLFTQILDGSYANTEMLEKMRES